MSELTAMTSKLLKSNKKLSGLRLKNSKGELALDKATKKASISRTRVLQLLLTLMITRALVIKRAQSLTRKVESGSEN